MAQLPYIPPSVRADIKQHIDKAIQRTVDNYSSVYEDEDAVTGALFAAMICRDRFVDVKGEDADGTWSWRIGASKFGGRGKGATESIIGADGIIELELQKDGFKYRKSLLFQSKIDWSSTDVKLYKQCGKMLTWLGAAAVFNYSQNGFEGFRIEDALGGQGSKPSKHSSLQAMLGHDFVSCYIGDVKVAYDARRKRLVWRDSNDECVSTQFNVNRRLRIDVKAPQRNDTLLDEKSTLIKSEDIPNHRLGNSTIDTEIYLTGDQRALKKLQNKYSKLLHPDKHMRLPTPQLDLLNEILQQFNTRVDVQKNRLKKRDQNK